MSYDAELKAMEGYADRVQPNPGEQRSPEWLAERNGHCTASRFKDVMDFSKTGKAGAKRTGYLADVVIERLTGRPTEHFVNAAMEHGTLSEPAARLAYEAATGSMVTETGFLHHKDIQWVGGSPDGTIDNDGLIEIKAPTSRTHIDILLSKDVADYLPQIQGLLWITGRKYCDFVSYDPRMPEGLQLYIQRIERDDAVIVALAGNVIQFLSEVQEQYDALMKINAAATQQPTSAAGNPSGTESAAAPVITADEALLMKAGEFAECGTAKYSKWWLELTPLQRKTIGAAQHEKLKGIAEKVPT